MDNVHTTQQIPVVEFSEEIDGRIYTVRAFFKKTGETMQQKMERMIEREIKTMTAERI